MRCEKCRASMIEKLPDQEENHPNKERAVVFECLQCGQKKDQRLLTSFWRRLAA